MPIRMAYARWYLVRWRILARDKFTCRYCGQFAPNVMLEIDHVIALADGGLDDDENLITSCRSCNRGKEAYRASEMWRRRRGGSKEKKTGKPQWQQIVELLKGEPDLTTRQISERLHIKMGNIRSLKARIRQRREENLRRAGRPEKGKRGENDS